MTDKLSDFDTLECPRCDAPTKPSRINQGGSVRYRHDCGDGIVYSWTITRDGSIANEMQTLRTASR